MTRGLHFTSLDALPEKLRARIADRVDRRRRDDLPAPAGHVPGCDFRDLKPQDLPPGVQLREAPEPTRRKYRNKPETVDGIRFDSRKEARYYQQLKLRVRAGDVKYFHRQVPIHLAGGTRYVVDFVIFEANGRVRYVDVKGRETQVFRLKKREVEHRYPIVIELA